MSRDPYKYFRIEARELAEQLVQGVLEIEKGPPAEGLVPKLLRLAHTLKGAARVVKQVEIADAAHAIEDTLSPFRSAAKAVPRDRADAMLRLLDGISNGISALSPPAPSQAPSERGAPEETFRTVRADVAEMDALLNGLSEAHIQLSALRRDVQSLDRAQWIASVLAAQLASTERGKAAQREGVAPASARVRSLAEELQGLVAQTERNLSGRIERAGRELRQVRETAGRLRLLPASIVFASLERTARDTAHAAGKTVVFEGRGGEVRLDTYVLGIVQGALVQIVRNAVAHGIEPGTARRVAGKPPDGRIQVEVMRRGDRVAFVCRDDGRGVDVDAVRVAAERKGLIAAGPAGRGKLGAAELLRLLLKGGLTTSGAVTEVSGRGIGLDIVREAAERLGGDALVETKAGEGTTVQLVVPVSLSSLDALIVEASGVSAAIPLDAVRGTFRAASGEVTRTPEGETVIYESQSIPFLPLERSLARNGQEALVGRAWSAVVIRGADETSRSAAIGVDRLRGIENVVLRPLPHFAPADSIVAGACLDAEGNPRIVLDAEGLVARAMQTKPAEPASAHVRPPLLIIDDSLTTRMLEQSILEGAGYEADVAVSGEEALAKARQRAYALFLVDIEMPEMDGFTFVERARADPALRDVPALIVTSRNSPEDRQRAIQAGALAFIVKNEFDQNDLLERIRQLVK